MSNNDDSRGDREAKDDDDDDMLLVHDESISNTNKKMMTSKRVEQGRLGNEAVFSQPLLLLTVICLNPKCTEMKTKI